MFILALPSVQILSVSQADRQIGSQAQADRTMYWHNIPYTMNAPPLISEWRENQLFKLNYTHRNCNATAGCGITTTIHNHAPRKYIYCILFHYVCIFIELANINAIWLIVIHRSWCRCYVFRFVFSTSFFFFYFLYVCFVYCFLHSGISADLVSALSFCAHVHSSALNWM